MTLSAKDAEDTPYWRPEIIGPDKEGYWEAGERDQNYEEEGTWKLERTPMMHVHPGGWVFRCKRYP
jgi:hypothetical protein